LQKRKKERKKGQQLVQPFRCKAVMTEAVGSSFRGPDTTVTVGGFEDEVEDEAEDAD